MNTIHEDEPISHEVQHKKKKKIFAVCANCVQAVRLVHGCDWRIPDRLHLVHGCDWRIPDRGSCVWLPIQTHCIEQYSMQVLFWASLSEGYFIWDSYNNIWFIQLWTSHFVLHVLFRVIFSMTRCHKWHPFSWVMIIPRLFWRSHWHPYYSKQNVSDFHLCFVQHM